MKSNDVYDYVVIGAGLGGLLMSRALQNISSKVLLLDGADSLGGMNHAAVSGFRFLPDTETSQSATRFLQGLLPDPQTERSEDVSPVTFESGALRPFVGFGDHPPAFYDEISYFLANRALRIAGGPSDWCQQLAASLPASSFQPRSMVTKFLAEGGLVHSVLVNGQKQIHGHNFVYCGPVRDLHVLLPDEVLSPRQKHKLSKGKYWTAVGLDLVHAQPVTEARQTFLLNGTTDDDLGPCAGQFLPASEDGTQVSQWVSFLDNEDAEESENIANALKKIKRQLKRVYPEALEKEKIILERIQVAPGIGGTGELKLSANQSLPSLPNLFVASGAVSPQRNLLGTLAQAQLVASALGYSEQRPSPEVSLSL